MAQKDYVRRDGASARRKKSARRQQKSVSVAMISIAVLVLALFAGGLFFLAHQHKPSHNAPAAAKPTSHGLPPKPEQRWRYIKELENRKPGVSAPSKPVSDGSVNQRQLTDEQRQLLEQIQADMRQPPTELKEVPWNGQPADAPPVTGDARHATVQTTPPSAVIQPAAPPFATTQKATPPPPSAPASTPAAHPPAGPVSDGQGRWMLQCGSFKNQDQAESVRAQLAFEGFESHISASDGWQRVVIGPFADKQKADAILQRLAASGHSHCLRLRL